jgi:glycine oxidase
MRSADVVVVGAGVVGAAIAYALARCTQARVVVYERGTPGCEASNAAAGVLAVASVHARRGALFELRRASAAMFPALVAALEDDAGMGVGYRRTGLLSLALSESQAADLQDLVRHRMQQGLRCEMLDRAGVLSAEPAVSPQVCAGALFGDDATVDSARLVAALAAAAGQRGVEFRLQSSVRSVCSASRGVEIDVQGERVEAGVAVIAAGAWCGEVLASSGIKVPLRPARGEMAAVRPATWGLRHVVSAGEGYLVPRDDGEVLIGSTTAFAGFDKRVTADGLSTLVARAVEMVPQLRDAPLARTWAGLRPCPTIRRPIIAALQGMENVILATGHHRNGILLAPITAQLVTEMISGAAPSVSLAPFSYRRH